MEKSCRNSARYSSRLRSTISARLRIVVCSCSVGSAAAEPVVELADQFAIGLIKKDTFNRRGFAALELADLAQQKLDRLRIARGGLVDQLFEHRLALGDPFAFAVLADHHRLVQRLRHQR